MDTILYGVPLTNKEFKDIFLSGVTALQLSIIPQYTDAVFVGGYKEVALARAKYLFMVGLTSNVPSAKEDVAILNDGELDKLKTLKLLIEPKISIVNKRNYESTGLCLSSFAEKLFISYPLTSSDGKENVKSELVEYLRSTFTVKNLSFTDEFLTVSEALTHFAKQCGNFSSCKIDDIPEATAFYQLVNSNKEIADKIGGKAVVDNLLTDANKEFKVRLSGNRNTLLRNTISPTTIESYYSCPYKAFLSKTLQLNDRDEGEVSPMSVGNIVHKIFELFLKNLTAFTEEGYINALNKAINDTVNSEDFCVYLEDVETNEMMLRAVNEAKIVCRKMYEKQLKSKFITAHYEVPFGDGQYFPALEIANGKYKMKGKIDRVDYYDDYFRIVDYKTGTNFDVSGKGLFTGTSLQLYLYSKIISDKENKQLAGMYYLPVNESYKKTAQEVEGFELKGKTIEDENIITAMDSDFETYGKALGVSKLKKGGFSGATGKDSLNAQLEYALKMCENATTQMASGVIASSPVEEECKYCAYKGLCSSTDLYTRKVGEVVQSVIDGGIKGDKTDG
jgi:ATP-dependent helicase/nuclease subunit B